MSKKYYSDLGDYKPYKDIKNKDKWRKESEMIQIRLNLEGELKFKFIELSRQMDLQNASNNEIVRAMINKLYKEPYSVEIDLSRTVCGHPIDAWTDKEGYSICSICGEMDLNYI